MTKEEIIYRIEHGETNPFEDKELMQAVSEELEKDPLGIGGCFDTDNLPEWRKNMPVITITE